MSRGRVVRILDRNMLIINLGRVDGVSAGDRFGIFTEEDAIIDPVSNVSLGQLRLQKASVEATRIHERFTVCVPTVQFQTPWHKSIASLSGDPIRNPLPVSSADLDPLPGGMEIHVGDPVEKVEVQHRAVQEASKQPSPPDLPRSDE